MEEKKETEQRRNKSRKKSRRILAVAGMILLLAYLFCLPRTLFQVPYSTVVVDRHQQLLGARIAADGQWRFPPRTTVPEKFKQCLLCFEDQAFYHHPGVNPLAIGRALYQNVKEGRVVSGGSTLTMQTIRLARRQARTWGEKIIEAILATRLELRCSKDEILALYASHAPFGGNTVGLDAATWRYFARPADKLSWAEAALLAVLPNAPSILHPGKRRSELKAKRNRLLTRLWKEGTIDRSTYELALQEPLPEQPLPLPQIAPHLVDYYWKHRPGAYLRTTLDASLQTQVEHLVSQAHLRLKANHIRNLAVLVIDNQRNEVVSYCGNVHPQTREEGSQVDLIRSPRSTGSILKPFLYAALLEEGEILPQTLVPDIPVHFNGFTPQNAQPSYEGAVPAADALARSLNIPAVVLLQRYGIAKFQHLLQSFGLSTLNRPASHYGLSLILGGAETTLWDITNAYAVLAGKPKHRPARLCDTEENPSLSTADTLSAAKEVLSPSMRGAAWQILNALTEVHRPEGIDWKSLPSLQRIAWKTGTSHGNRDAWAVGVTPRYTVGVWVGNASGEGRPGLMGVLSAGPVLFDVFNLLPASPWFEQPRGIFVEAEVCRLSGHLKGRFCEETDTVLVLPHALRSQPCPYHHRVTLSADGQHRLYTQTPSSEATRQQNWFTLPPVWEWYYKQHHPSYRPLPPLRHPRGEDRFQPLQFIYPPSGARLRLPAQLDGSPGQLTAEIAHSHPQGTLFWHLDGTYLTQTADFHRVTLQPERGSHTLTVVDEAGHTTSCTFIVE